MIEVPSINARLLLQSNHADLNLRTQVGPHASDAI